MHGSFNQQKNLTQDRLVYFTSLVAVGAAASMAGVKIYGWYATQSIVMLAALIDSLIDGLMSVFIFFSVRYALQPADKEHRFGHGKAEAIAAFLQALLLLAAAGLLLWQATFRIYEPRVVTNLSIGIYASAICVVITFALVMLQSYAIKKTGSLALRADSLHYRADIALYVAAIGALVLTQYTSDTRIDALFGVAVGGYIIWQAVTILIDSFKQLMDHELPDDIRAKIKEIVRGNSSSKGIHELRTRMSGRRQVIQFHIEMDGNISLHKAHQVADEVETALLAVFPNADVIIHQDPEGLDEQHTSLEKN